MDADERLDAAWKQAVREQAADGRDLSRGDAEVVYKLGWLDGFNAAMSKAQGLLAPAVADFKKLLEGT